MTRVMAVGVFDILHVGHLHYLSQARALGDELVVVVATDASVRRRKRAPILPQELRARLVGALRMVDRTVVGHEGDQYKTVEEVRPDVIALGHDDGHSEAAVEAECRRRGLEVRVMRIDPLEHDLAGTRRIISRILEREGGGA